MEISFWPIIVCAIIAIFLGSVWYSPVLFGKAWIWMRILKVDPECMKDPLKRKEAQKKMMPVYGAQFLLSLFQLTVLSIYIHSWGTSKSVVNALWICLAFVIPTIAGECMWGNYNKTDAWQKFFIQSSYNIVAFIIFGLILGNWN